MELQDELDTDVHVIGTPNEEEDGAKCTMVKQGVFKNYNSSDDPISETYPSSALHSILPSRL